MDISLLEKLVLSGFFHVGAFVGVLLTSDTSLLILVQEF